MNVLTENDIIRLLRVTYNNKSFMGGNGYSSIRSDYEYIQVASNCIKQIPDVLFVYVLSRQISNNDYMNPHTFHCSVDTIHVITKNVYYILEGRDWTSSGFSAWSPNNLNYSKEMRPVQKSTYSFDALVEGWEILYEFMQRTSQTCNTYQQNELYVATVDQMVRSFEQKTRELQQEYKQKQERMKYEHAQKQKEKERMKQQTMVELQEKNKEIIQLQEQLEAQKIMIMQLQGQNERLLKLYKGCQIMLSSSYKGVRKSKRSKRNQ